MSRLGALVVAVAKWLTHRIVIPTYVGSIPISHPIPSFNRTIFPPALNFPIFLRLSACFALQTHFKDQLTSESVCDAFQGLDRDIGFTRPLHALIRLIANA